MREEYREKFNKEFAVKVASIAHTFRNRVFKKRWSDISLYDEHEKYPIEIGTHFQLKCMMVTVYDVPNGKGYSGFCTSFEQLIELFPASNLRQFKENIDTYLTKIITELI